jgi:tight adherence protein B
MERRFQTTGPWQRLENLRQRSGVSIRTAELIVFAAASALVLVAFAGIAGSSPIVLLFLVLADLGGFLIVLSVKARRRMAAFDDQLPDLLDQLAASLKAGHSFSQAVQAVAADAEPPARDEFERVLAEGRLGRPIESAFRDMNARIGSKEFEFVLTAVTIQQQVGGSLASLLEMVAQTVRQRHQFARKLSALTATGRISAYVLVGLPFGVALFLSAINSSYMSPLFHTSTGRLLIVIALIMIGFGALLLRRIVSFTG